jgi:hypothetical protein
MINFWFDLVLLLLFLSAFASAFGGSSIDPGLGSHPHLV